MQEDLSGTSKYHLTDTVFIWVTSKISCAVWCWSWGKSQGKKEKMPHRSVVGGLMMAPGAVPPSTPTVMPNPHLGELSLATA